MVQAYYDQGMYISLLIFNTCRLVTVCKDAWDLLAFTESAIGQFFLIILPLHHLQIIVGKLTSRKLENFI